MFLCDRFLKWTDSCMLLTCSEFNIKYNNHSCSSANVVLKYYEKTKVIHQVRVLWCNILCKTGPRLALTPSTALFFIHISAVYLFIYFLPRDPILNWLGSIFSFILVTLINYDLWVICTSKSSCPVYKFKQIEWHFLFFF